MDDAAVQCISMECIVCGKAAKSTCGSCNVTPYCTVAHQKQHWKVHRINCHPYKIASDSERSQTSSQQVTEVDLEIRSQEPGISTLTIRADHFMIATRDLKAGQILWEEPASFYGPLGVAIGRTPYSLNMLSLCISCGADLQIMQKLQESTTCARCSWPVCGKECEMNPVHSKSECSLFANPENKIDPSRANEMFSSVSELFTLITIIRGAALKRENPNVFQELRKLYECNDLSHLRSALDAKEILKQMQVIVAGKSESVINGTALKFDDEALSMMFQLIQVYGFVSYYNSWADNKNLIHRSKFQQQCNVHVYNKASYLTHSCIPNCTWTIGPPPHYPIRVMSSVSISKGDKLTVTRAFYPRKNSEGTLERQKCLSQRGISCRCARCMDPSELETFTSAVTCALCRKNNNSHQNNAPGYMLPVNPLNTSPDAPWKCTNMTCDHDQESFEIDQIIGGIRSAILSMQNEPISALKAKGRISSRSARTTSASKNYNKNENANQNQHQNQSQSQSQTHREDVLEEFLKKIENFGKTYDRNQLHPNHWALLEPIRVLTIGEDILEIPIPHSLSACEANIRRIEKCLELEAKFSPGISIGRASIQAKLAGILCAKLTYFSSLMSPSDIKETLQEINQAGNDALRYFKNDFPHPGDNVNYIARYLMRSLEALPRPTPKQFFASPVK